MPIEQKSYDSTIMGGIPYYDDFNQQKKFLKILFKPGLPVQARELSQAQTILQNQIERLGSNIFRNGSVVLGGGISTITANFIRLQSELPLATLKRMVNQKVRVTKGDGTNVDAIVCGYADKSSLANDEYQILFIKYTTVGEFEPSETFFTIGLGNIGVSNSVLSDSVTPGSGSVETFVTVDQGVFYVDGYFCLADAQSAAATTENTDLGYRTFLGTNSSVGFNARKTVVDTELDTTLRDPSFGFNNFNAPGADRFKIDLVLESRSVSGTATDSNSFTIDDPTDFFELVRIINGKVTKKIKYPDLAELEKTLARRTFDESGNYTVNPFEIEVGTHEEIFGVVDESKFGVRISPGKAYVSGFEFETIAPTLLTIDKGNSTLTSTRNYNLGQGSFFRLKGAVRSINSDGLDSTPDIQGMTLDGYINNTSTFFTDGNRVDLEDAQGNVIGSCTPTHFMFGNERVDAPGRLYFHTKTMTGKDASIRKLVAKDINDNEIFGVSCDFSGSGEDAIVTSSSKRIVDISSSGSVNNIVNPTRITVVKPFRGTTDANGVVGFTSGVGSKDFLASIGEDTNNAQVRPVAIVNVTNSGPGSGSTSDLVLVRPILSSSINNSVSSISLNFGSNLASRDVTCFLPMSFESKNNIRKKTLSGDQTATVNTAQELVTQNSVTLGLPDVFQIKTVRESNTNLDVTSKFELNTGQDDFNYNNASIRLIDPGDPDIDRTSEFVVTFNRFLHSGEGPFTKDSYSGIKSDELYKIGNEQLSPLDVLDFRPILDSSGNYNQGTGEPNLIPFDSRAVESFVTVSTFLPRIDSVVLTASRQIVVVSGIPDDNPQPPRISSGDLELYRIRVNGADSDSQTLQVEYIDNQRFTMSDINTLDERTTDDFVENYKKNLRQGMVARGNARFLDSVVNEDDVYIDDLVGYENIDVVDSKVNVAFDPIKNTLRPAFKTTTLQNFTFGEEIGTSGTTFSTDGIALVNFTEPAPEYISQTLSNNPVSSVDINPFGINDYLGSIKLTPHRAKYWSESRKARVVSNIRGELNAYENELESYDGQGRRLGFGTVWKDWEVFWCGIEDREREIAQTNSSSRIYKAPKKSATIKRILSEKVRKTISGRVIDLSIKPYLDSFTLRGVVEGVLPGATYNLFFDGVQQNLSTQPYQASTGPTAGGGTFDFTTVIPADTYTIGKKLVRVVSGSLDDSVIGCDSSADAIYYGEGRPNTELFGDTLIRPVTVRRKASDVNETSDEYYSDVFEQSSATIVNALNPVSQTFNVDAEFYPSGLFLHDIRLWFTKKDKDVTLRIHPTRAGNPLTSVVMPFSEITEITKEATLNTSSTGLALEVSDDTATRFKFTTPVFLPAGEYSISISTNDTETNVITYDETSGDAPIKPSSMLRLYLPQNDGSVVGYTDQYLAMKVSKCAFETSSSSNQKTFVLQGTAASGTATDALFISSNPPINSNQPVSYNFNFNSPSGSIQGVPNSTIESLSLGGRQTTGENPFLTFSLQSDGDVCSVIDTESVAAFLPVADVNGGNQVSGELSNEADLASDNHFRYYSKVVESDSFLSGIVISVDGLFRGLEDLRAFVRTARGDENIFDNDFIEVLNGGPAEAGSTDPAITFDPNIASNTFFVRLDQADQLFQRYQIKIVGVRDAAQTGFNAIIPEINFLGAAPVRSASAFIADAGSNGSQGDSVSSVVKTGTILPVLGNGDALNENYLNNGEYLLCNGQEVSKSTYANLFTFAVQSGWAENDAGSLFALPNLKGRTLVGAGIGTNNDGTGLLTERTFNTLIGNENAPGGADITVTNVTTQDEGTDGTESDPLAVRVKRTPNTTSTTNDPISATSSGGGSTNLQPSLVVNYIIKT